MALSTFSASAQSSTAADPAYHIKQDLATVSEFFPRTVNSAAERRTFDYIREVLEERDISFSTYDFSRERTIHSFSGGVDAVFPGKGEDELYFIVPVSYPPSTAPSKGGSAGIALGLALCRQLAEVNPAIEVHVLFLGADFGGSPEYSRGSRAFLERFYSSGQSAFVYLHFPSLPEKVTLLPASTQHVSPYWLLDWIASNLQKAGTPTNLNHIRFQLYRLGLNDEPSPVHPYFEEGYPSIYLTGEAGVTTSDRERSIEALHRISSGLGQGISELGEELPNTWDRHYQYFSLREGNLKITQREYVLTLLLFFLIVIAYPFFRGKRFIKYSRSIIRNIGALPILYLLMFLYLYLATLLLEGVTLFQSYPLWWEERPLMFLLLKLSAAAFLFVLSHKLVHSIHFTRLRGSFYSASALVFLLLDIIILSTIDLSLSLYGAVAFLFAFFFSIFSRRIIKLLFLLLALFSTAAPVYLLFTSGMSSAIHPLLLSRTTGNLLIAFHVLPFMLLIIRMRMLFHHPNPRITRRIIYAFDLLFGGLTLVFLVLLLFSSPFGEENPQPVVIHEHAGAGDSSSQLRFSSPAPLEHFTLFRDGEQIDVSSAGTEYRHPLSSEEDFLETTIGKEAFLNRTVFSLQIEPRYPPQWLRVRLTSPESIVLYDSRFPFSYTPDRRELRFDIGRNPSVPLELRFTLPDSFTGEVEIEAEYEQAPFPLEAKGKPIRLDYRLTALQRLSLDGEAP